MQTAEMAFGMRPPGQCGKGRSLRELRGLSRTGGVMRCFTRFVSSSSNVAPLTGVVSVRMA